MTKTIHNIHNILIIVFESDAKVDNDYSGISLYDNRENYVTKRYFEDTSSPLSYTSET